MQRMLLDRWWRARINRHRHACSRWDKRIPSDAELAVLLEIWRERFGR